MGSRPGEAPLPTAPTILPFLACLWVPVAFPPAHMWFQLPQILALEFYCWRLLRALTGGLRLWDPPRPGEGGARARTIERMYERDLAPSVRLFGVPSLRERLEAMGYTPAWPAVPVRGLPWGRLMLLGVVTVVAWVVVPRFFCPMLPPETGLGVGVGMGILDTREMIAASEALEPDDPRWGLLLAHAFDHSPSDRSDADLVLAYVAVGDCDGAERVATASAARRNTRPERQEEVAEALAWGCGPEPREP